MDLDVVDSVFGKTNSEAPPAAPAGSVTDDGIPDDAQPIEPIARTAPLEGDPEVAEPPADEAAAARAVAQRLGVAPYLDISKLPPEAQLLVKHHLENLQAKQRSVTEKERKAGDALEHADLVRFVRDDPEANQVMRELLERRRVAALQGQPPGQPAPRQPTQQQPTFGLPDVREEFQGLGDDQLAVIERLENRNAARQQQTLTQVRDTVVALLQHVVGPIKKQQADAEASRQWTGFTGAIPDWNRHASLELLKQRQEAAPHVPIDEHFFAAAGPKLYAENQQLKRKLSELMGGNRPSPPRVTTSRRQNVEPVGDMNDLGTFFDAILKSVGGA